MTDKRIIDLQEIQSITSSTYVMTDSLASGVKKFNMKALYDTVNTAAAQANAAAAQAIDAKTAAQAATTAAQASAAAANTATAQAEAAIDAMGDISELAVPLMSSNTRGGAKLGSGLEVEDGTLSLGDIVTDSCDGPIYSASAEGWSEQVSTMGKNLLKPYPRTVTSKGVTYTMYDDGTITLVGTATGNESFTVTFSQTGIPVSAGTYTASCDSQRTRILGFNGSANDANAITQSIASDTTITPSNYPIVLYTTSGVTYNDVIHVQLEVGDTATSIEPYSGAKPSPSPEFPQAIEVCRGRNLFDKDSAEIIDAYFDRGTEKVTASAGDKMAIIAVIPNTTYTISVTRKALITATDGYQLVAFDAKPVIGSSGSYIAGASMVADARTTYSFTTNATTEWIAFKFGLNTKTDINATIATIQLELGSTPTPYVPYGHVGLEAQGRNLIEWNVNNTSNYSKFVLLEPGDYILSANGTLANGQWFIGGNDINGNYLTKSELGVDSFSDTSVAGIYSGGNLSQTLSFSLSKKASVRFAKLNANGTIPAMLELGSTAHAYEPYYHETRAIPLPLKSDGERWAGGLPDGTADELSVDSAGRYEWVNECDVWTEDSNLQLMSSQSNRTIFSIGSIDVKPLPNTNTLPNGYATHFIGQTQNDTWVAGGFSIPAVDASVLAGNIAVTTSPSVNTIELFKAAFAGLSIVAPLATPTTEHGFVDLPMDIPVGASIDIPELRECGVKCFVPGAKELAIHAANWGQRAKEQESRIAALEAAVAELATS